MPIKKIYLQEKIVFVGFYTVGVNSKSNLLHNQKDIFNTIKLDKAKIVFFHQITIHKAYIVKGNLEAFCSGAILFSQYIVYIVHVKDVPNKQDLELTLFLSF